eukprot:6457747-Amphidinium_carterae.1
MFNSCCKCAFRGGEFGRCSSTVIGVHCIENLRGDAHRANPSNLSSTSSQLLKSQLHKLELCFSTAQVETVLLLGKKRSTATKGTFFQKRS